MATNRIVIDLGPDEQARLSAESRRRGVDADAVIVNLVRALPEPDAAQRTRGVGPAACKSGGTPKISEADVRRRSPLAAPSSSGAPFPTSTFSGDRPL